MQIRSRKQFVSACAVFGQRDGVSGGNSTKQIRFDFSLRRSSIIQSLALRKDAYASPEKPTEAEPNHDDGAGGVSRSAADVDRLDGFSATLQLLLPGEFSTADFIYEYQSAYPAEWLQIESQHGEGGKGAGQHRTVFTHVAHRLSALARQGGLYKLDYHPAPDWWGNAVVQFWSLTDPALTSLPEPAATDPEFREGSLRLKKHLQRERHWGLAKKKKAAYISTHGKLECERCRLDPVKLFGSSLGETVIEVHHAEVSVAAMVEGHRTKLSDLQCLCANCHRLVHAEINASVKAAKLT